MRRSAERPHPACSREARPFEELVRVLAVLRRRAGNDLFKGDRELVRVEQAALARFLSSGGTSSDRLEAGPTPFFRRPSAVVDADKGDGPDGGRAVGSFRRNRLDAAANVLECLVGILDRRAVAILEDGDWAMLPAISADLPAYLLPPTSGGNSRQAATEESKFGPASRVDVAPAKAIEAQSQRPNTGLYGPDGQFVEGAARREVRPRTGEGRRADARAQGKAGTTESSTDASGTATDRGASGEAPRAAMLAAEDGHTGHERELALAEFDAIIPPAAREELDNLADRIRRRSDGKDLEPRDYKQIAELMTRVGRHDDAMRALARAEELENGTGDTSTVDVRTAEAARDEQEAGAAEDAQT